ncbi:MAG: hypothetical protein IT379_28080 [Deltaproteobacteria bacterium]|nr:hypothetical protein [Deltaproteobacteria bacterium]
MRRDLGLGVFIAAIVGSLVLHAGGVVTLEVARVVFHLAESLKPRPPRGGVEIDFDLSAPPAAASSAVPPTAVAQVTPPEAPTPTAATPEVVPPPEPPRRTATPPPERPRPRPRPPRPQPRTEEVAQQPAPQTPRTLAADQHMIEQRSDDPSVPPPENPRFLARENRRVEEETVATVRNLHRDDQGDPSPGRPNQSRDTAVGSDDTERAADLQDREGDERRAPTATEVEERRPRRSAARLPDAVARGDQRSQGPRDGAEEPTPAERPTRPRRETATGDERVAVSATPSTGAAGTAGAATAEAAPAPVATDAQGAVAVATQPQTTPGTQGTGGVQQGPQATPSRAAPEPSAGRAGRGRGIGRRGTDLRVSWRTFEETFGEEQLREEREAFARERRSKSRGSYAGRWTRFRGAIENYVPFVRPGNQTALSAAASPFASYLAGVHRRIHRFFADDFLASLDGFGADHAMNDPTLVTRLEIILNRDGTISRVGVAATSGMLPFDFGAVDSVHRGAPFPSAPEQILSGDGRVYMHWSFYRNTRACGTFNAEPYILPRPGERQRPAPGPTEDRPPPGRRQIPPGNLRDDMTGSLDQERRRTGVTSRSSMRAIDRSLVVRSRGGG